MLFLNVLDCQKERSSIKCYVVRAVQAVDMPLREDWLPFKIFFVETVLVQLGKTSKTFKKDLLFEDEAVCKNFKHL